MRTRTEQLSRRTFCNQGVYSFIGYSFIFSTIYTEFAMEEQDYLVRESKLQAHSGKYRKSLEKKSATGDSRSTYLLSLQMELLSEYACQ